MAHPPVLRKEGLTEDLRKSTLGLDVGGPLRDDPELTAYRDVMDRRAFLRRAGAGALGLAAARPLRALAEEAPATKPLNWTWGRVRGDWDADRTARYCDEIAEAGVGAVLMAGRVDADTIRHAHASGLKIHHWLWTLCRGGKLVQEHPDWYAVNRKGESTSDKPPYVHYYRFLCPSRDEVVEHLVNDYVQAASREGLDGVHLDYVRYPDVILPRALWKKYDLVQDTELPAFDYCYCEVCRKGFEKEHGEDPLELPDPPASETWRQWRLDRVTRIVNRIAAAVKPLGKQLTAAVFPTPSIARRLVRQDWTRWDLDAVLPMTYHGFYEKPVGWIEEAVREGVAGLAGKRPLYPGLYLSMLQEEADYERAVAAARAGGASGIALFGGLRKIPS